MIALDTTSEQLTSYFCKKIYSPKSFIHKTKKTTSSVKKFSYDFWFSVSYHLSLWLNVAAWFVFVYFDQCCITISNTLENNLSPGCQTSNTNMKEEVRTEKMYLGYFFMKTNFFISFLFCDFPRNFFFLNKIIWW